MPTQAGNSKQSSQPSLTPEARAELAEQRLAEALQQLEQVRHRADVLEAKLRELNIPLDFLPQAYSALTAAEGIRTPVSTSRRSPQSPATIDKIYTDGACSGNPGPGGWGTVIYFSDGSIHELGGFDAQTTNNRMEMQAAIAGLEFLTASQQTQPIILYTDSEYLKNGITQWIHGWKKKGWKTSTGKPVLNQDLWQLLDKLNSKQVEWRYVRGHAGNEGNERCDAIARSFALGKSPLLQQK